MAVVRNWSSRRKTLGVGRSGPLIMSVRRSVMACRRLGPDTDLRGYRNILPDVTQQARTT